MKTNKNKFISTLIILMLSSNFLFAQLQVKSNGDVGIGTLSPLKRLHIQGNAAIFTSQSGTPTSCAFINCNNSYSGPTNPDYTWYNDVTTGMFHYQNSPTNEIGFTVSGSSKMWIVNDAVLFSNGTRSPTSAPIIRSSNYYSYQTTPDFTWYGEMNTGMYHPNVGMIGFSIQGNEKVKIVNNAIYFPANSSSPTSAAYIRCTNGYSNANSPDYSWYGNDLTGIFHPSSNIIGFSTAGTERMKIIANGQVAIGGNPYSNMTFSVNGTAWCTNGIWTLSDKRYKKNIKTIEGALNKVLKLNGTSYEFRSDEYKNINFNTGKKLGFIAQELNEVLPEVCSIDSNGYFSINYDEVIPVLVEAIKEQHNIINEQSTRIDALELKNGVSNNPNSNINNSSIVAKLYQNNPNPFSQKTEIKCLIPNDVKNVELFIYDMQGTQIKKISISGKGEVSTTIQGSELNAGMYMYTLIIDGKEIDTKRMILTN